MIQRLMNAPINTFYDVTPSGRILNKLSKDLSMIELGIPFFWITMVTLLAVVISILIMSVIVTLWMLAVFPFLLLYVLYYTKKFVGCLKELTRIESITKSPVLTYLGETTLGASTIRAHNRQLNFVEKNFKLLDCNILANHMSTASNNWFTLKLDYMSMVILTMSTLFCIINHG